MPKIKNEIKIKGYRSLTSFNKKIINAIVSKKADKFYVSVLVEEISCVKTFKLNKAVGIDLEIKNLVVSSDEIKYEAMQNISRIEKKIKGLNRWLSRCIKGFNNRRKVIEKIQRVNLKLKNIRKYYTHLITSQIVKENDIIITESLKVKNMIENSNKFLTKQITNSSFSEILRQLKYKCLWSNKRLIQVDTYFPSSQICCHCGEKNGEVKNLSIREWYCPKCLNKNDRDLNASINILFRGIERYYKEQLN